MTGSSTVDDVLEGEPVSLWIATAGTTSYPVLDGDVEVDVAVIGAGVAGLTTAWGLKRAGRSVAVLEAARVGTGVTGNTTGKVTSLHRLAYTELLHRHGADTARAYGQANQAGLEHIAHIVATEGIDCDFRRVANYTYAESEEALALVRDEAALAGSLGLPAAFTTDVPLPFPVRGAVRFDDQAQLQAVAYVQGLARALHGDGSFVFEQTRARSLTDGAPCEVGTEHGTIRARDVIVATNVPFADRGSFDTRCRPFRSYLVAARTGGRLWDATFISADEPQRSILSVGIDGAGYLLAGGEGHPASERVDSAVRYRKLAAFVRDRLAAGEVVYRWSTQDAMPADGLPYVGLMSPTSRHVYVVTGLRKWGLSNATAAALILTDTICGEPNPWAQVFDSNRTSGLGTHPAKDSAAAEDTFPVPPPFTPADLAALTPGDGAVWDIDGDQTAVYKDTDGRIHAVSAICTHLGCTVEFNAADTTWDCPCHGSRFATDGTVIHDPAVDDLAPAQVPAAGRASRG